MLKKRWLLWSLKAAFFGVMFAGLQMSYPTICTTRLYVYTCVFHPAPLVFVFQCHDCYLVITGLLSTRQTWHSVQLSLLYRQYKSVVTMESPHPICLTSFILSLKSDMFNIWSSDEDGCGMLLLICHLLFVVCEVVHLLGTSGVNLITCLSFVLIDTVASAKIWHCDDTFSVLGSFP